MLNIGGYAAHIPYHTTWAYEHTDQQITQLGYFKLEKIADITQIVRKIKTR